MGRVIGIVILEQLKHFFRKEGLWLRLLAAVGIVLLTGIYSFGFGFLLMEVGDKFVKEIGMSVAQLVMLIIGGLGALGIVAHFFPTYQPKKTWIPRVFPVSPLKRFGTEVSIDFISLVYLGNVLFFLPPFFMADLFTWQIMVMVVSYTVLLQLVLRAFQTFFQDAIQWKSFKAYTGVAVLVLSGFTIVPPVLDFETWWWLTTVTAGLSIAGAYLVERAIIGTKEERADIGKLEYSTFQLARTLIWNTKPIRTGLITSFVFKVVILAVTASGVLLDTENNQWLHYYLLFFALPPFSLFTYVYNNVFGYLRSTWLTIQKSTASYKDLRQLYANLIALPLLVDFTLSTIFVLYMDIDPVFFFGMYLGSLVLNYIGGLFWSIYFPRPIKKALSMKGGNTSPMSNFFVIGIVLLLYTIQLSYWFLLIIPLYAVGAVILNKIVKDDYQYKQYQLYEKLFKE